MKKRILRALSGIMLSALLTVTVAVPVGAACGPTHNINNGTVTRSYPNASENSHKVREVTVGECTDCGETVTIINTYSEPHLPDSNGKCYQCGYPVWHRPY